MSIKIGPPTGEGQHLRVTAINQGMLLSVEMTWKQWDELEKDAHYLRAYGKVRQCSNSTGTHW